MAFKRHDEPGALWTARPANDRAESESSNMACLAEVCGPYLLGQKR